MAKLIHLYTLLDIIIMMLLGHVMMLLCLTLSKMTGYINEFNENKDTITMSLRGNDEQFLKKYNKIWKKFEKLMRIDFERKPTYGYDDKYIKTKIKNMQTL